MLNDQVMQLEKIFLTQKQGLPLQNSTKHVILSFENGGGFENHGRATFPGIGKENYWFKISLLDGVYLKVSRYSIFSSLSKALSKIRIVKKTKFLIYTS